MLPKLVGATKQWLAIPLRSGLVFWVGGAGAWLWSVSDHEALLAVLSGAAAQPLLTEASRPLLARMEEITKEQAIVVVFLFTFLATLSQVVVKRLTFGLLRVLEGYKWPGWLAQASVTLWDRLIYARRYTRLQALALKKRGPAEECEYALLDRDLMYLPEKDQRLPTRLGNLLRAYELRPYEKYGLNALICWPRLWLLLPKHVRDELQAARENLDHAVEIWFWGMVFTVWIYFTWWAAPLALLQMYMARQWLLDEATTYGELVEAAYDLHRLDLYRALRWPLPSGTDKEWEAGQALTAYLWRGAGREVVEYVAPPD